MDFSKLTRYLASLEAADIPAADVEVRRGHEVVYRGYVGHPDAERKAPMTGNELYLIFSCSKVSLCLGALKLVEEGRLAIDDPVSKYLPEFASLTVRDGDVVRPANTELLVRHCFLMEGGWSYGVFGEFPEPETVHDNITMAAQMAKVPLHFDPGTRYEYGTSQDVLGAIIEKITGKSLGAYLDEVFFTPLGMTDTGFHPDAEQQKRLAAAWVYDNERNKVSPLEGDGSIDSQGVELGSGGLYSTVHDYSLFMDMIANGGVGANGVRVLKEETLALCRKNLLEDVPLSDFRRWQTPLYGYGWGLCGRVHINKDVSLSPTPVGEFGWNGAAAAYCMADTENKVSIYIGMQVMNCNYAYNIIHHRIRDLAYEALGL